MKNNYSTPEPRSPKGASAILADSGIYKKGGGGVHWSMQKNLPWQVKQSRLEAEFKARRVEVVTAARHTPAKSVFLVVKKIAGNRIKPIGFSETFANFAEVKEFAKSIGREKVRMGAVVAKV